MKKKTRSRITKILIAVFIVLATAFIFRGFLYRMAISYKDDGGRKSYKVKDKNLAIYIEDNMPAEGTSDIESIVSLAQDITSDALDFSFDSRENDPNKTVLLRRANSVGYAAFTAAVGNYLIDKNKLSKVWEAKPVKGKLFLFGNDLHKKLKDKSYKDHDFVIFKNKVTGKEICVDPMINDKYGIDRITKY